MPIYILSKLRQKYKGTQTEKYLPTKEQISAKSKNLKLNELKIGSIESNKAIVNFLNPLLVKNILSYKKDKVS